MAATTAVKNNYESFDRYRGETKNQMRHGKGVYVYTNEFFKYDGQWKNGEKHGRGKLLLGDGGYYEGTFVNGEIEGHGYKVFGLSGSTYTGQFHNGEFHGYGLLANNDGSQYEGGWYSNKRDGQGILRGSDGSIFEGEFHNHKQHGTGTLLYSDGDSYEGDWINGLRHGHGIQTCTNGTIYEGQWKGGVYHGEGSLVHTSGFRYKGMWYNGRPAEEPVRLSIDSTITSPLIIEQGHKLSVTVNCVNDNGDIINDNGRSFMVSCFIDKNIIKRCTNIVSYAALMSNDTVTIPPHGEVYNYEIVQTRQDDIVQSQEAIPLTTSEGKLTVSTETVPQENKEDGILHSASLLQSDIVQTSSVAVISGGGLASGIASLTTGISESDIVQTSSVAVISGGGLASGIASLTTGIGGERLDTKSMYCMNDKPKSATSQERFLSTLVSPKIAKSNEGRVEFKELYIPPPPAPQLESVIKKTTTRTPSVSLSGQKPPRTPVGSPIIPHSPSVSPVKQRDSNSSLKKKSSTNVSKTSVKKPPVAVSKNKTEKEKLLHVKREKYCATGTYIIQISEVTSPAFLDKLPPVFIEVKVISPKPSSTGRETSLDKLLIKNRSKNKQK